MFRFIRKLFLTLFNALMLIIAIPQSYDKFLKLTKLNENDNKIILEIVNFFKVFEKYENANLTNYFYLAIGIIALSLLMEFISIFTYHKHFYNFLTSLIFLVALVAFNVLYIYAKIKLS